MVRFNYQQPNAAATFAGLSKTIRSTAGQLDKINKLAREEEKAQEAFQADLDSVFGLVGKGLSEDEYKSLVQEQNAIAQKQGIIQAHENFALINAIEEERAKILISSYGNEMKKYVQAMSNPTQPMSLEQAEQSVVQSLTGKSLGQDSVGNDVFMNMEALSTGELVALSRGMAANNLAIQAAVEDNKHDLAIQAATVQYGREVYNVFDNFTKVGGDVEVFRSTLKNLSNKYYGFGVEKINSHTLNAVQGFATDLAQTAPLTPDLEQNIYDILDELQDTEIREGAGGFAAPGTENFLKLEQIKNSVRIDISNRTKAQAALRAAQDELVEDELNTMLLGMLDQEIERLMVLGEGKDTLSSVSFSDDFKTTVYATIIQEAKERGYTNVDGLMGNVDSVMSNLSFDGNDRYVGLALHEIDFGATDLETLKAQEQQAYDFFEKGIISFDDYKTIRTAAKSKMEDLVSGDAGIVAAALKEGGFGTTNMRTQIIGAAEDILKLNDQEIKTGQGTITRFARDNDQLSTNRLLVEQRYNQDRALAVSGGTLKVDASVVPFTEEEKKILMSLRPIDEGSDVYIGIPKATIESVDTLFRDIELPPPGEDRNLIRSNVNVINQRAIAYSQYLAMRRLIDSKAEADAEWEAWTNQSFSGDSMRTRQYIEE